MRLKHVHISDYKNLKNFELSFDSDSALDVFVGKNGSGKSNFFEALIEIFRHINEFDSGGGIDFDYHIIYEIENDRTSIQWANSELKINDRERKTLGKATSIPDNILIYYSGHNDTVSGLIGNYLSAFQSRIKGAGISDSRYFIGIGSEYKQLLLAVSLLKTEDSRCRRFICKKLGIAKIGTELRVALKRPYYADSPAYDVQGNDNASRFWKAEGITLTFLEQLSECLVPSPEKGPIRPEGHQAGEDKYILYLDIAKISEKFKNEAAHELFNRFDNLKVLEMLEDISIPLELTNGEEANTSFFSDGQFQSVYIFAITELFKERHCLTLLDEPDSFLHPEWQHEFLGQIFEISDAAAQTNHTLLSSHSASTISSSNDSLISLFEIDGNSVKVSHVPKGEVIASLSAGLITFSESEARLNIHNVLSNTTGPVLFTEGITDEIILETAWSKLYPGVVRPFEIQNAFDCIFLANLLSRDDLYSNHPGRKFFGIFDFDEAYNRWNGLNKVNIENDPGKCLTKKCAANEGYALLLPVPTALSIKNQVLNTATGGTYKHNSLLTIELLFHDVPGFEIHFAVDTERTDGFKKFVGNKVDFAKTVVANLDPVHFKVFEPVFDFIKSKCVIPTPGVTAAGP